VRAFAACGGLLLRGVGAHAMRPAATVASRTLLLVACLLLAGCASRPAATPNDLQSEPPPLPREHAARLPDGGGLENAAQVSPVLYRGAQPDEDGYERLRELGVRTVVSLRRFHSTREQTEAAGLGYLRLPIYAAIGSEPPSDEQVRRFFATVLDPDRQPVYVHCKYGSDRTGVMAALYRIECDGWSNDDAIREMQAFGYHDVYRDLIDFVRDYEPRGFAERAAADGERGR